MGRASRKKTERVEGRSAERSWGILLPIAVIAGIVYSNTFSVPFILDDSDTIMENAAIRSLARFLDFNGAQRRGDTVVGERRPTGREHSGHALHQFR